MMLTFSLFPYTTEIGVNMRPESIIKYDFMGSWRSTISENIRVGFTTTNPKGFLLGFSSNTSGEYMTIMVSNSGKFSCSVLQEMLSLKYSSIMSSLFAGDIACTKNNTVCMSGIYCIYHYVTGLKIMIVCCILPTLIVACPVMF